MKKGCMFVFAIPSGGKTSSLATSLLSESKAPLCPTPQSLPTKDTQHSGAESG